MLRGMRRANISEAWQVKLIMGYVGGFTSEIEYVLISRRSAGVLNECSDEGCVPNYVESEQLIRVNGVKKFSYRVARGSAWRQPDGKVTEESQRKAFTKHMNWMNAAYGRVECINLAPNGETYKKFSHPLIIGSSKKVRVNWPPTPTWTLMRSVWVSSTLP
jgi:hypothetical protein